MAVYRNEEYVTVYYIGSLNGTCEKEAKKNIPEQLYETVSKMGASVHPKRTLNPEIEVVF